MKYLLLKTRGDKVLIGDNVKEISSRNFDTVIIVYPTYYYSSDTFSKWY
jgi:hypothetical protein